MRNRILSMLLVLATLATLLVPVTIVTASAEGNEIVIDGSQLTNTATTGDTTKTYSGIDVVFSKGAKFQSSSGTNRFADKAILIGKNGAYIYNTTAIPGKITKFEVYANSGASKKVTVAIRFGTAPLTESTGTANYTAKLETLDHVYEVTPPDNTDVQYFRFDVTNANNAQVQFRITYEETPVAPSVTHEHNFTTVAEVPATCEATGTKAYRTCSVEGCEGLKYDAVNEAVVFDGSLVIAKLPHTFADNVCTAGCGKHVLTLAYELGTGESMGSTTHFTLTGEVTEIDTKGCPTIAVAVGGETKTIYCYKISGDALSQVVVGVTITVTGEIKNYNGTVEFNGCTLDGVTISSCNHEMTYHEAVPATCTENGTIAYYSCSVCEKNYTDGSGTTIAGNLVAPATGHNYTETVTKEATCTEEGEKTLTCSVCGDTTTEAIAVVAHTYENGVCTVCGSNQPSWAETAFADLKTGDTIVIVSTKGTNSYAMSNENGASAAPAAVEILVNGDRLKAEPAENLIFTVVKDGDNIQFKTGTNYLYTTNSNNGLRVGTNSNNVFVLDSTSNYLKNTVTNRYLGVYNNADWRCYTSANGNIIGQTFKFYVQKTGGAPAVPTLEVTEVNMFLGENFVPVLTLNRELVDGEEVKINGVVATVTGTTATAAAGIAPRAFADEIVVSVGDATIYSTTLKDFLGVLVTRGVSGAAEAQVYCQAAAAYFANGTEVADVTLSEMATLFEDEKVNLAFEETVTNCGVKPEGASLGLNDATLVYIKLNGTPGLYTVKVDTVETNATINEEGYLVIRLKGAELTKTITVEVMDADTNVWTLTYSVPAYVNEVLSVSTDAKLNNLVKALLNFAVAIAIA